MIMLQRADLQGGKATEKNWERGKYKPIHKCVIGKTKDRVYVVFQAAINARGSNTDKAVGLAVSAVPLSTGVDGLASEKWFDGSEVVVPKVDNFSVKVVFRWRWVVAPPPFYLML